MKISKNWLYTSTEFVDNQITMVLKQGLVVL